MLRDRRAGTARNAVAPATMRSPGLVRVRRSTTPEKLRDLLSSALVRIELAIAALDEVEGVRHAT